MKRFSLKSIIKKSYAFRNEQAIKKIAQNEDLKRDFESYGGPKEYKKEKSRSPFSVGSLCLSILP